MKKSFIAILSFSSLISLYKSGVVNNFVYEINIFIFYNCDISTKRIPINKYNYIG